VVWDRVLNHTHALALVRVVGIVVDDATKFVQSLSPCNRVVGIVVDDVTKLLHSLVVGVCFYSSRLYFNWT